MTREASQNIDLNLVGSRLYYINIVALYVVTPAVVAVCLWCMITGQEYFLGFMALFFSVFGVMMMLRYCLLVELSASGMVLKNLIIFRKFALNEVEEIDCVMLSLFSLPSLYTAKVVVNGRRSRYYFMATKEE
ncbi:hypothetical protein [Actomonas aquatica]|uniref:Uncharacterized protein n=1 Tax=Actomonas aquatica TaxID=2866162 RepID=A0ABZ1C3H9_9BACT|nr:hypothetical protein [Opitutus sp. WL0086]WRQ85833.1 hypothetical protein K1X11_013555 [Opitutus sp. WL0086]